MCLYTRHHCTVPVPVMSVDVLQHTLDGLQEVCAEEPRRDEEITYLCTVLAGYVGDGMLLNVCGCLLCLPMPLPEAFSLGIRVPSSWEGRGKVCRGWGGGSFEPPYLCRGGGGSGKGAPMTEPF